MRYNNSKESTVKLDIVKLEASLNSVLTRKGFEVDVECPTLKLK